MRLVLVDRCEQARRNFYPLSLNRPIWELRCGFSSLAEKLTGKIGAQDVAYFVPDYMADAYRAQRGGAVNDLSALAGDDLLILDGRVKADALDIACAGPSEVGVDAEGGVVYARIAKNDLPGLDAEDIDGVCQVGIHLGSGLGESRADHGGFCSGRPKWNRRDYR